MKSTTAPILGICLHVCLLAGCGDAPPVETTLSALSAAQTDFNGRQVAVTGTLRTYDSPKHYWIENDRLDRIAIQGVAQLAPLVGQDVKVKGRFKYDRSAGRRIEANEVVASPRLQ